MTIEKNLERIADALEILAGAASVQLGNIMGEAEADLVEEPPVEKPKGKPKAKSKAKEPEPEPEEEEAEEVEEAEDDVSIDDVKTAARELVKNEGRDAVFEVLKKFKVQKVSDLDESQYAKALAGIKAYQPADDDI